MKREALMAAGSIESGKQKSFGRKRRSNSADFLLIVLTMALVIFGIIMVFSASYYTSIHKFDTPYHFLKRHMVWAFGGTILLFLASRVPYKIYRAPATLFLAVSFVLLLLIFTPIGMELNNARRWLGIEGIPVTIMPGELAKISIIIFVAAFLSRNPKRVQSLGGGVLPLLMIAGVFAALIIKQPNLSTALTVVGIVISMMFIAGLKISHLIGIFTLSTAGVLALVFSDIARHWKGRLVTFLDPFTDSMGEGYQVVQSLIGIGSGGFFGKGLGHSVQKSLYLPEPQNDFISTIIGEEFGFLGLLIMIVIYMMLVWRCVKVCIGAPDSFSLLLAGGITTMIALQMVMNIAVVTSSMPATGVTLPFVSYGGNALLLFMGSMGIMINISKASSKSET